MRKMGYEPREIEESLKQQKYDDMTATYLLLGRKPLSEVGVLCHFTVESDLIAKEMLGFHSNSSRKQTKSNSMNGKTTPI